MSNPVVAFITTWGDRCGIATYSEELVECLLGIDVRVAVFAPNEPSSCQHALVQGVSAAPLWGRSSPALADTLVRATKGADIVHFQHEHGLFRDRRAFFQVLRALREHGRKTVVTLHTASEYGEAEACSFFDTLRSNVDVIVTHTPAATTALSLAQGTAHIVQIPHGTRVLQRYGSRVTGLQFLRVPERYWSDVFVGTFGFIGAGKAIHNTIKCFCDGLARRFIPPTTRYLICGDPGQGGEDAPYVQELLGLIGKLGYTDNVFLQCTKFVPRERVRDVMAAFDCAVLNTSSQTLSASGQVHLHAAHHVPLAVANRPIYHDAVQAGAVPFDVPDDSYKFSLSGVNAISALAASKAVRASVKQAMQDFAIRTAWPKVAGLYKTLYGHLTKEQT